MTDKEYFDRRDAIANGLKEGLKPADEMLKRERRYALLQAAATLASSNAERYLVNDGYLAVDLALNDAEELLKELERREEQL